MDSNHLIAFNIILVLAILSPGPAFIFIMRTSLAQGRAAGIRAGLGLGLIATLWTAIALLGLDIIFSILPGLFSGLKLLGGAYLLYLGYGLWRDNGNLDETQTGRLRTPFIGGVLINLGNPKSVLFAASIMLAIFPSPIPPIYQIVVPLNQLLVEWICATGFACFFASMLMRQIYARSAVLINRVAGTALIGFGGVMLLTIVEG